MPSVPEYAIIRWTTPEGFEGVALPLPRARAEAVAAVFARLHPEERTWLEPVDDRQRHGAEQLQTS